MSVKIFPEENFQDVDAGEFVRKYFSQVLIEFPKLDVTLFNFIKELFPKVKAIKQLISILMIGEIFVCLFSFDG